MKQQIIGEVAQKLKALGLEVQYGNGTDLSIEKEFLDASWSSGKKKISYEATIFVNEAENTVFMHEKTLEISQGTSFGFKSNTFTQSGTTLFRKVKSIQYGPDGKAYEYDLDLGAIPKAVKDTARGYGWKFKTVLQKKNAMYPDGYQGQAAPPPQPPPPQPPPPQPPPPQPPPPQQPQAPQPVKTPSEGGSAPKKKPGKGGLITFIIFALISLGMYALVGVNIVGWAIGAVLLVGIWFFSRKLGQKSPFLLIPLYLIGAALLFLAMAFTMQPRRHTNLGLGKTTRLAENKLPAAGGTITVGNTSSSLNGMALKVSSGAFSEGIEFKISETEIKSHQFGELFNPASPLITIDNGHLFANSPMTLTIPIQLAEDEFAMGFYFNSKDGTLEGIPASAMSPASITLMTSHFSDIVITKVKKSMLEGRIQNDEATSDFLPGMSDFKFPNYGSYAQPDGHCAGQSIAMLHYYNINAHDAYSGKTLRGDEAVDNNSFPATKDFWLDDSYAYRLSSLLGYEFNVNWKVRDTFAQLMLPEDLTYYSFAYAMALTHSPQLVVINSKEGGHAMVVYDVKPGGLAIADPNFPGELTRTIKATKIAKGDPEGSGIDLADYRSGSNAGSTGSIFNQFAYVGTYALIDFNRVDALWSKVLKGEDVGDSIFIPDLDFVTLKWDSAAKKYSRTNLGKEYSISRSDTKSINSKAPDQLFISIPFGLNNTRIRFYNGTKELALYTDLDAGKDKWALIPLTPGVNDIGIYYERVPPDGKAGQYSYINFYRFKVNLSEDPSATPTPKPTSTPAPAATPTSGAKPTGQFKLSYSITTRGPGITEASAEALMQMEVLKNWVWDGNITFLSSQGTTTFVLGVKTLTKSDNAMSGEFALFNQKTGTELFRGTWQANR